MKAKAYFLSIILGAILLLSTTSFAQTIDSAQAKTAAKTLQENEDKQRLNEAVDLRRSTKTEAKTARANAREADRIEDDAADAAKQAKLAARTEARAQRTRHNADKQAKKAERASNKSNNN
ncbi:hypothetical protein [Adhaeribacter aquaticus]|uniref:hypothetical protein n=1 Tax=Adhaeribacter aquaticus TaxID=299567 RepID=UPI000413DBA3|nr:hypothetical protein [Adhaeribacter aquaticus]